MLENGIEVGSNMIGRLLFYNRLLEVSPQWLGTRIGRAIKKTKPWNLVGKRKITKVHNKAIRRLFGKDSGHAFWNLVLNQKHQPDNLGKYYKSLRKFSK